MNGSALTSNDAIDMFVTGRAAHTILYSAGLQSTNANRKNYNGTSFTEIYMPYPNDSGKPILEFLAGGPCVFNNGDAKK